jgi:murein L,D-transpeptidase YafK
MRPLHRRAIIGIAATGAALGWLTRFAFGAREADGRSARVIAARRRLGTSLRQRFAAQGAAYPGRLYLRVFKKDRRLEMWAESARRDGRFVLVKTYPICASSGQLGPKRTQGDEQVPEGFYEVRVFNPQSKFHLSLGIDYPNQSDRALGRSPFGRDIMIHGGCATIGCVPIGDDSVEEVFVAAKDAHDARRAVTVHLFPTPMTDAGMRTLDKLAGADLRLKKFWASLRPAFVRFESTRRLPVTRFDPSTGLFVVAP